MKVYTRKGDDGSTGLLYGGRVAKDETGPEAYGTTDEAVAALGMARAFAAAERPELAAALLDLQRQLFVVGAELATASENRHKLTPGTTLVTSEMVAPLEEAIDRIEAERGMPTGFVVPGHSPLSSSLDLARTVVRRAERRAVTHVATHGIEGSYVVPYLNRLADFLWMAARQVEPDWEPSRSDGSEEAG